MSKNAITVIDQTLVDDVQLMLDRLMMPSMSEIQDLNQMAKDLIEINAELTKREQKLKSFVDRISDKYIDTFSIDELAEVDCLLKGDSDE